MNELTGFVENSTANNPFFGFTHDLVVQFVAVITSYQSAVWSNMSVPFQVFALAFTTLYIVIVGFGIMMGAFGSRTKQFIMSCFILMLVSAIIFHSSWFYDSVNSIIPYEFLALSAYCVKVATGGGTSGSVLYQLDQFIAHIYSLTSAVQGGFPGFFLHIKFNIALYILLLVCFFLYGVAFALYIIGIFCSHILLFFAPIYFFLFSFQETRPMFQAWVRAVLSYGILLVVVGIITGITLSFVNSAVGSLISSLQDTSEVYTRDYFFALFGMVVSIIMLLKAPDISAALTGTSPGSSAGIAAGVGFVATKTLSGVHAIGQSIHRRGDSLIKQGGEAVKAIKDAYLRGKGVGQ